MSETSKNPFDLLLDQIRGVVREEWSAPLQLESFHRDLRGARPVVLGF